MFKLAISILTFSCLSLITLAQNIKMLSSSVQPWSGGVAGLSGNDYNFEIQFSGYDGEPLPDTIWLGQEPIALTVADYAPGKLAEMTNVERIRKKNIVIYKINAGTQKNETPDYPPNPLTMREFEHISPPINYDGIALLAYLYNGTQCYYEIKKVMKTLPPINYP